jgi:hypothetical protein
MITEEEFRLGKSCPTKILHARAGLPRAGEEDSFAAWMRAEAGKVRALARAQLPPGARRGMISLTSPHRMTDGEALLDSVFVAEAVTVRVDYAKREKDVIRVYSIVPRAVDLEAHRFGLEFWSSPGRVRKEWRGHLENVALRAWAVAQLHPECQVVPLIIVPVRGATARIEGLHGMLDERDGVWSVSDARAKEDGEKLLRIYSVKRECSALFAGVANKVEGLNHFLAQPTLAQPAYRCKSCEFRVANRESGYERCLGDMARVTPHMFDLTHMYFIQGDGGQPIANQLLREKRVSMWDIPDERISGVHAARQRMQLEGTMLGREIIRPELREALASVVYPIHFLDIETLRSLVPAHRGTKVNELLCFQFSNHRRDRPDGDLVHTGWLNTERTHPNLKFLAALRAALGEVGSVLVWTRYEEVSFRELLSELLGEGRDGGEDAEWMRQFLVSDRLFDLHDLCFKFYFHPLMGGRTSIKSVLPATWSIESPIKQQQPYAEFPAEKDPYAVLKEQSSVSDGCEAMDAYLRVQGTNAAVGEAAVRQLATYCRVDTLAMAYVFDYWSWRLSASEPMTGSIVELEARAAGDATAVTSHGDIQT